ncbi:MAG: ABC transporter ATP-binding protein [Deltaproteobacteria bacterium]|nr:ABC transporter ATP-binding protein [Deltaproteobacteria bacterium]
MSIVFKNLWKSFGPKTVLRGINLEIHEGETLFIIGGSGTGKSVTIKHLIGLLRKDRGEIWIDGKEVSDYTEEQFMDVRKKCAMVFQNPALLDSLTIGENVAFSLRRHTTLSDPEIRKRVAETLALVNMEGYESKMPAEVSGGMQKRVSLARSIILRPKYVLYDEPTTGADPVTANTINDLIKTMARELKVTSIVVSHDMESVKQVANRVAMLYQGQFICDSSPEDIWKSPNPYVQQFITGSPVGPME